MYALYPVLPLGALRALGRLRGKAQFRLRGRERRAIEANVRAIVTGATPTQARAVTRRWFENQQIQNLLVTLTPRMSIAALERALPIDGLERLDRALAAGKGVLLLGTHLNSVSLWMAVVLLRRRGYDVRVALPIRRDPWAQTQLRMALDRRAGRTGLREQIGAFYAQFNIRPIVAALGQRAAVAMTGDGWHSASFVPVEFLGRTLPFTTGAMGVARSAGAMVVPAIMAGEPLTGVRAVLEEPFTVARTDRPRADLSAAVQRFAGLLDAHVRRHLAGWQHLSVPDVLGTMAEWQQKPLAERYIV